MALVDMEVAPVVRTDCSRRRGRSGVSSWLGNPVHLVTKVVVFGRPEHLEDGPDHALEHYRTFQMYPGTHKMDRKVFGQICSRNTRRRRNKE